MNVVFVGWPKMIIDFGTFAGTDSNCCNTFVAKSRRIVIILSVLTTLCSVCCADLLPRDVECVHAGLYFSAHWCPPCRGFTPELAKFYKQMKEKVGDRLEIIFISSDRTKNDWQGYFAEMPWLALPFEARDIKVGISVPLINPYCGCIHID